MINIITTQVHACPTSGRRAAGGSRPRVKELERFEDIEAWQLAPVYRRTGRRELIRKVYHLTKKPRFVMKSARRSTVNLTT